MNQFGLLFRVSTWGESHGPAIGCLIDGCPAGLALSEADIQPFLDRRRPGQSRFTTQRQEADRVEILSGVFAGQTSGTPIALVIHNQDQRSKDYREIQDQFRPGHADYSYWAKYGQRDYRGGGRASARETAMRVAAGAVALKLLAQHLGADFLVRGALVEMGGDTAVRRDWAEVKNNPFFAPDLEAAERWAEALDNARQAGSSLGAIIEVEALGVPAGLGEPLYHKLDAQLAAALMSINAAKGVEIGAGFQAARLTGAQNADEMRRGTDGRAEFLSNHAGGVLGGISSGQRLVTRLAIKPTSSILTPRRSLNRFGEEVEVVTKGRHDPCVGIRGVPVAEAMVALVLADMLLLAQAKGQDVQNPRPWDAA